ncbi:MAG: exo-alpha-sialidase [Chloroflexi bacterium]|nr:exo-alpha-sialidase [Chloroflexota bacterium]
MSELLAAALAPNPRLPASSPFEVVDARVLFRPRPLRRHMVPSLLAMPGGRLLLAFTEGSTPENANDGAIMLSDSGDGGRTWSPPRPVVATPGWFSLVFGGLVRLFDGRLRLGYGQIQVDRSLPGREPMTGWFGSATFSADGGETWSAPEPEIRLFPTWTEFFGGSSPHPLADGRLLWTVSGTLERDREWQAGVTFSGPDARAFEPVTLVAAAPDRDYSDVDTVRLADGRFLAVVREHLTLQSVQAWSADEGRTWSPHRPTPFQGSNVRLWTLRSGAVMCAYRDEVPGRYGVSLSVTDDGGESWRFAGQLYAAGPEASHVPGSVCGYPTFAPLGDDLIAAALHSYPTPTGSDLHYLVLRERS